MRRGIFDILTTVLAFAVPLVSVAWVMAIPQRMGLLIYPEQVAALMLGAALCVVFGRNLAAKSPVRRVIDGALSLLALALGVHVYIRFPVLSEQVHLHPTEAFLIGLVTTLLILEGLRRVVGWTLVFITAAMLLYACLGSYVPGPLQGRNLPFGDVMRFIGTDSAATWGASLQIATFVVVVFVLFGAILLAVGGGDFFTQTALRVAGRGPGSPAKVAVVASGLFGSISGSAVSNVMSTGVMTIPLMKRSGFRPEQAGAIEAVASTGGQLAPPVMGAAAFLMAEILQIPYREILLAALIPALLYYISLYVQIDFISRRDGYGTGADIETQPMRQVMIRGWSTILAFVILLGSIFTWNMRAEVAAVWASVVLTLCVILLWAIRRNAEGVTPLTLLRAIGVAGGSICDVLLVTAAAGIIVGLLSTTGLGFSLSLYLIGFGGENLIGLLVLTALIGIVLGLGLPTTAVYLLLASLTAPALVQLGIPALSAHMFVFYYGMLSMISPPIAMAAFAAASIAGSDPMKTGLQSFRFGWIAYVLPFLFIYKDGLLMQGSFFEIVYAAISSLIALTLITGGIIGHALTPLSLPRRLIWTFVGALTIAPLDVQFGPEVEYCVSVVGVVLLLAYGLTLRVGRAVSVPR